MYFEVDDVFFEGESKEAHEAERNNPDEAERLLKHALELFQVVPKSKDTDVLKTMLSLGDLYRKQDKLDKADDILLRALTGCENELGSEHELTLAVVFSLSVLYRILDKPSEAEKMKLDKAGSMLQRALTGFENKRGLTDRFTLRLMNSLAFVYEEQGKLAEAGNMLQRAVERHEMALGSDNISTLRTMGNLGSNYARRGRVADAQIIYKQCLAGYLKTLGASHPKTQEAREVVQSWCD